MKENNVDQKNLYDFIQCLQITHRTWSLRHSRYQQWVTAWVTGWATSQQLIEQQIIVFNCEELDASLRSFVDIEHTVEHLNI
jgi:hypothetical protein